MLYKKSRDMNPVSEYEGYILGLTIHDDSDGFEKHDYEVFELAEMRDYDDGRMEIMYDRIKTLDISPYEKNQTKIQGHFQQFVDSYRKLQYGLELTL